MKQTYLRFQVEQSQQVQQTIVDFLKENTINDELTSSMIYSIEAGGKRFRPMLFLSTLLFLKKDIELVDYDIAGAIEMVHTYSLIHDDLPAMDNDDLRRGKATNHVVYGESTAILAGDGLLTESFHLISSSHIKPNYAILLVKELAQASGGSGMISGQMADIAAEKQQVSLSTLQKIHSEKTGALIVAAVKMACLMCDTPKELTDFLIGYAEHIGLAFQIRDDLLDVLGSEADIGKPIGSDVGLGKSTYVSLLGIHGAKIAFEEECHKSSEMLEKAKLHIGYNAEEVTYLDDMLQQLKEKI